MLQSARSSPSLSALSACYTSALESLQIVIRDFAGMAMLVSSQRRLIPYIRSSILILALWSGVNHYDDRLLCGLLTEGGVILKLIGFTTYL